MTKIKWPAGTLLAPVPPALVSCGTMEKPNVMTAAWTGIICSEPPMAYVSVRKSRFSHELILQSKEFVLNLPNLAIAKETDFCGVKSGRDVNKFEACGFTLLACQGVQAPQIEEAPVSLVCRVKNVMELGSHDMFLAEILETYVDAQYLNDKGALCLEKAGLLGYAHGFYYTLGRQIGKFGFSVEKKKTIKKRRQRAAQKKFLLTEEKKELK